MPCLAQCRLNSVRDPAAALKSWSPGVPVLPGAWRTGVPVFHSTSSRYGAQGPAGALGPCQEDTQAANGCQEVFGVAGGLAHSDWGWPIQAFACGCMSCLAGQTVSCLDVCSSLYLRGATSPVLPRESAKRSAGSRQMLQGNKHAGRRRAGSRRSSTGSHTVSSNNAAAAAVAAPGVPAAVAAPGVPVPVAPGTAVGMATPGTTVGMATPGTAVAAAAAAAAPVMPVPAAAGTAVGTAAPGTAVGPTQQLLGSVPRMPATAVAAAALMAGRQPKHHGVAGGSTMRTSHRLGGGIAHWCSIEH